MSTYRSKLGSKLKLAETRIRARVEAILKEGGVAFNQDMNRRLSGPTGPQSLSVRTGALRRSNKFKVERQPDRYSLRVSIGAGTGLPGGGTYAEVQERGAVIRPKKAKLLAIPLAGAKTGAGVTRLASPRLDKTLKFLKTPGGTKLLVRVLRKGKGKKQRAVIQPMWVLVPSVRVPARLGFAATWKRHASKILSQIKSALSPGKPSGGK